MSPCQSCGACCARYRVSFGSDEIDDVPGGKVPSGLTEAFSPDVALMKGTAAAPSRCVALRGTIGESAFCAIYEFRPSACSEFAPLAAVGIGDEACSEARRHHRLPPLTGSVT